MNILLFIQIILGIVGIVLIIDGVTSEDYYEIIPGIVKFIMGCIFIAALIATIFNN